MPLRRWTHDHWEKLIWNIPFNGLAVAQGGVTTDVLLADPALETEIRALMLEVISAAAAQGIAIDHRLIDSNIQRTRPMGPYQPSTMIDFLEGRELELNPIWEEPLRRAKSLGLKMPALEKLISNIQDQLARRSIVITRL
jgi:2-dehydropantoate 2-reductase